VWTPGEIKNPMLLCIINYSARMSNHGGGYGISKQ
jgi:hypothetical protein